MRNSIILSLTSIALSLAGCKQTGVNPTNCREGKCTYTILANQQITIDTSDSLWQNVDIMTGDQLVFEYEYVQRDNDRIADDEYTERIYFEIDPEIDSFSFRDAELAEVNLVMQPICFCIPTLGTPISGTLTGEKLSETAWKVEMDVTFDQDQFTSATSFDAVFEKAE